MAKGFSDNEKKIIQDRLVNAADICWGKYGIKKTTVEELAKMACISKGAFYLFYQSKELLFFDVLERADMRLKDRVLTILKTSNGSRKQNFIQCLNQIFMEIQKSPWIFNLQNGDYELLVQKLPEGSIRNHIINDENKTIVILKHFNIDCDSSFVTSVMKSIFFIQLHEKEIGNNNLKKVTQFLIESLANKVIQEDSK